MSDLTRIEFDAWLEIGLRRGFISPPVCHTHDGLPTTEAEDEMWWEGDDPCVHILRLYEDKETREAVEQNHPATVWRNPFHGQLYHDE